MEKPLTDISVNSGLTGETRASVTPEKRIPRKKIDIKSLDTLPPGKNPITNHDINTLGLQKDKRLSPHVPPFPPIFKSLRNEADYDNTETTDISCTDKDDTSRTNRDDSIENLKATKNTNDDNKYKDYNLHHQDGN